VLLLSSCSQIASNYRVEQVLRPSGTVKSYIRFNADTGEAYAEVNTESFQKVLAEATSKTKKEALAFELMSLSDESCERHKSLIISNANTWNISTGTVTNVLAGLGTVVGGESTKAALSAGAALSNSSRSLVNEQIYANALATTILRAIELKRSEVKKQIYNGLATTNQSNYSAYQMLYDLDYYHQQCSFMVGMVEITKALENRKATRSDIQEQIKFLQDQLKNPNSNAGLLKSELEKLQLDYKNASY
jgi:hypothetical protein